MLRDLGKEHSRHEDKTSDNSKGCIPAKGEISATFNRLLYRATGVGVKYFLVLFDLHPIGLGCFVYKDKYKSRLTKRLIAMVVGNPVYILMDVLWVLKLIWKSLIFIEMDLLHNFWRKCTTLKMQINVHINTIHLLYLLI